MDTILGMLYKSIRSTQNRIMNIQKQIGKTAHHNQLGKVTIIDVPKGTYTKAKVRCIQRGPGWNNTRERYEPVKRVVLNPDGGPGAVTIHWDLCKRDEYGMEEIVHINSLTLIKNK